MPPISTTLQYSSTSLEIFPVTCCMLTTEQCQLLRTTCKTSISLLSTYLLSHTFLYQQSLHSYFKSTLRFLFSYGFNLSRWIDTVSIHHPSSRIESMRSKYCSLLYHRVNSYASKLSRLPQQNSKFLYISIVVVVLRCVLVEEPCFGICAAHANTVFPSPSD